MYIYKITNNVNGKVYIGQTVRTVKERFDEHCRHSVTYIDRAINKYGKVNFTVETIYTAKDLEELNEKEKYYISYYHSNQNNIGYNLCDGGDNTEGYRHREESKRKMSESKSRLYMGESNPFYHKHHSEEQRKKWSESRKGLNHMSEDARKRFRESHRTVKVLNVTTGEKFNSIKEAAERYNVEPTHITRVCRGRRKSVGGFVFVYDNTVPSSENSEKV